MKYVVSSQEKPQNFPIYSIHSDMDSFILYNIDMCPKTEVKLLKATETRDINEQSTAQYQKITDVINPTQFVNISQESPKLDQPTEQICKSIERNIDQEILWYLEFDGSANKLGAGAGVWIHNTQNDHALGHAYRLNFR